MFNKETNSIRGAPIRACLDMRGSTVIIIIIIMIIIQIQYRKTVLNYRSNKNKSNQNERTSAVNLSFYPQQIKSNQIFGINILFQIFQVKYLNTNIRFQIQSILLNGHFWPVPSTLQTSLTISISNI